MLFYFIFFHLLYESQSFIKPNFLNLNVQLKMNPSNIETESMSQLYKQINKKEIEKMLISNDLKKYMFKKIQIITI